MAHNVKPGQRCKLLTVQIAVPFDTKPGEVDDLISATLTEGGICNENSLVLDWKYVKGGNFDHAPTVVAPDQVGEGEIFRAPVELAGLQKIKKYEIKNGRRVFWCDPSSDPACSGWGKVYGLEKGETIFGDSEISVKKDDGGEVDTFPDELYVKIKKRKRS